MRSFLITIVKSYQYLFRPLLGHHCRFHPSCSDYAVEALNRFGALQGSWLCMRRIGRCHPWCEGGVDPVPGNDAGDMVSPKI